MLVQHHNLIIVTPLAVVRHRFPAGANNFQRVYKPLVNHWLSYDNSGDTPGLIEEGENP